MNFKIGEKVVCIKTFKYEQGDIEVGNKLPVINEMYTIRGITSCEDGVYFVFEELVNPLAEYTNGLNEIEFWSGNFRKLDYQFAENLLTQLIEEELCITK